ncbi:MAG: uracil-DNA glycosylase [Dissulfuribacterales bacterium]
MKLMTDISNNKEPAKHPVVETLEGLSAYLRFLLELGCVGMDCSEKSLEIIKNWGMSRTKKSDIESGIYNNFVKCRQCSLAGERKNIVYGDGDPEARLLIVGGIPEPDDIQAGKPYSGKAGELLNKIISAMNLTRKEIYITHAVKCCLPDKMQPNLKNIAVCRYYLMREFKLVKPEIVCALGEIATKSLLETSVSLSRLRGRFHDYQGFRVMPTYSPEYLLDNPDAKRMVWEDIKKVMVKLGKG